MFNETGLRRPRLKSTCRNRTAGPSASGRGSARSADRDTCSVATLNNVPGDATAKDRLEAALAEYKKRIAGV